MSMGDNDVVSVSRIAPNEDGHLVYGGTPLFTGVSCSIVRISPERMAKMDLGDQILAYDMHVGQALALKIGDRIVGSDGTRYDVFTVDIIRDFDPFTRAILKREYTDAEGI
jgi:hypothetical protein